MIQMSCFTLLEGTQTQKVMMSNSEIMTELKYDDSGGTKRVMVGINSTHLIRNSYELIQQHDAV